MVRQLAEDAISQTFVEAAGLELEGVEPHVVAAAIDGFRLGAPQQFPADALAAQRLRHKQQLDEQPPHRGARPQPTHYGTSVIGDGEGEQAEVIDAGLLRVEGNTSLRFISAPRSTTA